MTEEVITKKNQELIENVAESAKKEASKLAKVVQAIKTQYIENYKSFITGVPTALVAVPLTLFFLSPSASRGVFLFGAIFASIVALIFTPTGGNNFLKNSPSFHGIALGYIVGYLLMENIQKSELGTLLSTCVMGIMLVIVLTVSMFDSSVVFRELLHVGIGWIVGIFIGLFFSFTNHQTTKEKKQES